MSTLNSAVRGLPSKKKNLKARMRRVSLCVLVYLIWEERNKRIFDDESTSPTLLFQKFWLKIKNKILAENKQAYVYPQQCSARSS